ncbi:MAG: NAD(+) kinase [Gammaproteobacteria bacterium]|nr:NAD(+) kinase [Gammaproteobacteria bacterium]MDH4314565.1 NAD(+) kinase [Gammaproteobacteria bacterium]MDH5213750.1 NAD(+) kinase [Gammaproteobacteria bacterium]MDH5499613.1 NAD(+) kinase [Gammaproteobacteria bacterium]
MTQPFNTIALVGRFEDERVAEPMEALARFLTKVGKTVIANPGIAREFAARAVEESAIAAEADLIIAVGGDGTMLYAAKMARHVDVPLLGVNRGRLGFLTDVLPSEMLASLARVLQGEYSRESRLLLDAHIESSDGRSRRESALNDIVLQRAQGGRMLAFDTRIDGKPLNSHAGDGLIVATPTGSTAYALSCGGPIIEPSLNAVVIVPVCPHTLSDRPIVISANLQIEVVLHAQGNIMAEVTVDGVSQGQFGPDDKLTVSRSMQQITLIHPPGYDFYEILRSKLHWGHDSRFANS